MSPPEPSFAAHLDLALKALSIGRGRLAQEIGVDKSLVSRWLNGSMRPSAHNLERITRVIAAHCTGFTMLDWERDRDGLAARLGVAISPGDAATVAAPPAPADEATPAPADLPHSRAQSLIEVAREGHAYPGVYASFRVAFRNTGELLAELIVIWRDRDRLFFRSFDPSFSHTGELFIVRHQLFAVGEDDARADGLMTWIINGVAGQKLFRTDGLAMSVAGDRYRTPGAAPFVLQRIADLTADGCPPPPAMLTRIAGHMKAAYLEGRIDTLAGPRIVETLRAVVGAPGRGGATDHLLRLPIERSPAASEVELTPEIGAELMRVRDAFVADAGAPPLSLGRIFAPARLVAVR